MSTLRVVAMWALFVAGGASVVSAQQPVTLTSTADFKQGNNEGLISTADDRATRDRITAGTVAGWSSTTALPLGVINLSSVAHNGFLYAIGGYTGPGNPAPTRAEVLVAPIIDLPLPLQVPVVDGSIGAWSATTALPSGRRNHTSVAYNGFLYVIGGVSANQFPLVDVLVAPFNANGSVGAWSATTALPSPRDGHTPVAYNGFLYIIGGGGSGDVLVAPIQADGSVGAWSATTSLPSPRGEHTSVAYNGFLYVLAGDNLEPGRLTDVLVAPIQADGSVGAWSATTSLPSPRDGHNSFAYSGFLYAIGGADGSDPLSDVLFAPINADGSIGAWSATTALPSGHYGHASSVYNGFVYTLGGSNSDVLVAPIDADLVNGNQTPSRLRGIYSRLVDLQADSSTRFITINGQLSPGGVIRLQARVAPDATEVFGAETVVNAVTLGSAIEIPGAGRYVWIRLTLDDTATSNAVQATYVSDIAVSPQATSGLFLSPDLEPAPDAPSGKSSSCGYAASAAPGSVLALLGGLALLGAALRRRQRRT